MNTLSNKQYLITMIRSSKIYLEQSKDRAKTEYSYQLIVGSTERHIRQLEEQLEKMRDE